MRRKLIAWSVVLASMACLFAVAVVVLNATLFTASGFARVYLDSLARHDARGALELPGVEAPEGARTELLDDHALSGWREAHVVGESAGEGGIRLVEVEVVFDDEAEPASTTLAIAPAPPVLGVFAGWRFASSPVGIIAAEPLHAERFAVNDVELSADAPVALAALTPGRYTLSHESALFTAEPVHVALTEPGAVVPATVDIQASQRFVDEVQQELHAHLDECTTQRVLLPAGCPFGHQISNRVESEPQWSITRYPTVSIVPGEQRGTWRMPPTDAAAHLTVDVRSLFDGTRSTFDEDVPFTVAYDIRLQPDGSMVITATTG